MDGDNENVFPATIAVSTSQKDSKTKSHISIEEFLNFLKTAYQVFKHCLYIILKLLFTDMNSLFSKGEIR